MTFVGAFIRRTPIRHEPTRGQTLSEALGGTLCPADESSLSWGSHPCGDLIIPPLSKSKGHFNNGYCVGTKKGPPNGEVLSLVMGGWKKEQKSLSLHRRIPF